MEATYSIERLIALRREIHQNPEGGFQQFQTKKRIIDFLTFIGIAKQAIKQLTPTGFIVDISGKKSPQGKKKIIALRADMDALSMTEDNPHLSYQSKKQGFAHMCGHDGHVVCLLAFAWKYLRALDQIPQNKTVRLLFQPSEQGPQSGAKVMVQKGALEDVDEIYGFHNWPSQLSGKVFVKQGPIMNEIVIFKIRVVGTKGHGSSPELVKDAIKGAARVYQAIQQIKQELTKQKLDFVCTIPVFKGGERYNVFSEDCCMEGTIRILQRKISDRIVQRINLAKAELQKEGFTIQFKPLYFAPAVVNSKAEASHVERIAKIVYGEQNVGAGVMPVRASEDFSYYLNKVPGAFFFVSSGRFQNSPMVHSNRYDFNDDIIEKVGQLWLKLTIDRLSDK